MEMPRGNKLSCTSMVVTRYWGDDCDNEVEDHCEPDGKQDRGEAGVCYYATRPKDGVTVTVPCHGLGRKHGRPGLVSRSNGCLVK